MEFAFQNWLLNDSATAGQLAVYSLALPENSDPKTQPVARYQRINSVKYLSHSGARSIKTVFIQLTIYGTLDIIDPIKEILVTELHGYKGVMNTKTVDLCKIIDDANGKDADIDCPYIRLDIQFDYQD